MARAVAGAGGESSPMRGVGVERGQEIAGVLAEPDASGGDRKGGGDHELEDVEEGEGAAEAGREHLAEEAVGAAGVGHHGAEFSPHQAVAQGQKRTGDPAEHGLRAAHRAEQQGQGDEGAYADHVEHVDGYGSRQGEGARELSRGVDRGSLIAKL